MMKIFELLCRFKHLVIVLITLLLSNYLGTRIIYNPSMSELQGYYFLLKKNEYKKNSIVQICVDNPKYLKVLRQLKMPAHNKKCLDHMDYLLKTIVGVGGDKVVINKGGVFINGVLQNKSNAINNFRGINLYPTMKRRFILRKNEFFVLGITPHSYDSRYFGVIKESQIAAEAYLIYKINHRFW